MGVYFVGDLQTRESLQVGNEFHCLYCELVFMLRHALNDHYLTVHREAFSEEELRLARLRQRVEST